jgi:hypothetical protein
MSAIIFIDRNKFDFIGSNIPTTASFPFQPTVVRDIEVLNIEELQKQVKTFIDTHKIKPTNIAIVLSPTVIFDKDIPPETKPEQQETIVKQFIDNVPFNNKVYKLFTIGKATKLAATNSELFEVIKEVFEDNKFTVDAIAPSFLVAPNVIGLTADTSRAIFGKFNDLRNNGFPLVKDIPLAAPEEIPVEHTNGNTAKPKSNRTFLLLGIFVLLLGILFAVLLYMRSTQKPTPALQQTTDATQTAPQAQTTTDNTAQPTIVSSPTSTIAIPTVRVETLRVQILNGSGVVGQAEQVKTELEKLGLRNIQTGNAPNITLSRTLIVFTPSVPADLRQNIMQQVEQFTKTSVSSQENSNATFDIVITTSKP